MKTELKNSRKNAGFTLVELLVVIAIIAILAGILIPMISGVLGTAHDSQSTDACSQCADAWAKLQTDNKRFPNSSFILNVVGSGQGGSFDGGDVYFHMTPSACALLNFWKAKSKIPAGDAAQYKAKCTSGQYPTREDVEDFGAYTVLECSTWQKCFGYYAPWVERAVDGFEDPEKNHDEIAAALKSDDGASRKDGSTHWGHGIVVVALDTNGDGKLTLPKSLFAGDPEITKDIELRSSAAAWVWNENRTKVLHSW